MRPVTYSIKDFKESSDKFYADVSRATDTVLTRASINLRTEAENYLNFIQESEIEKCRSFNEYLLEFILIGVLWRNYEVNARKTPVWIAEILNKLYLLRSNNERLKPLADKLRGALISSMLYHEKETPTLTFTYKSFRRLLKWLNAAGEFKEEVKRLNNWLVYMASLDNYSIAQMIKKTYYFADYFEFVCKDILGEYTLNVKSFIANAKIEYKGREDFALASRKEVEYHLNMVGAEILNRELRERFILAKQKIVLLPTCMKFASDFGCGAKSYGLERMCTGCNIECNIGKVSLKLKKFNIDTFLIPHSSDFTKFLERWKDVPDIALVGVACVLNLLMGGYEMINLGIASQCVFLDHCGCKKHWDREGIPTSISVDQLLNILDLSDRR